MRGCTHIAGEISPNDAVDRLVLFYGRASFTVTLNPDPSKFHRIRRPVGTADGSSDA